MREITIFTIRRITERAFEYNGPAYFFMDLEKAFDTLELKTALDIL